MLRIDGPGSTLGPLFSLYLWGNDVTDTYPFCVGEQPYVLWSANLASQRDQFLKSIDSQELK